MFDTNAVYQLGLRAAGELSARRLDTREAQAVLITGAGMAALPLFALLRAASQATPEHFLSYGD